MDNPGIKIILLYSATYIFILSCVEMVYLLSLPGDLSLWASIISRFALISWLTREASYKSRASIALLMSIIATTLIVIIQYISLVKDPDFAYSGINANIEYIHLILTIIDILLMIWITIDGISDKSQRFFNEPDTVRGYMRDVVESCKTHKGGDKKA